MQSIYKFIPGLQTFRSYKAEWFTKDLIAGVSVAAIALPVSVAYAGLAGFPPEVGLYSAILPMVAFALFGSSKQLIVGPDSATCMMVASVLLPFAVLGPDAQYEACILLSLLAGIICILGGVFRLGFLADFLSKPILTGYLNGLAFTIIMSQLGKVFGYKIISGGFFRAFVDFLSRLSETNILILIIGVSVMVFLVICKKISHKIPAPLIAAIGSAAAVYFFGLKDFGVYVLGPVPQGLPSLGLPQINFSEMGEILPGALSLVIISYCSGMLTDKSFAMKSGYEVNANQEFIGFGAANIASAVSGGFVVSGADSRTAVGVSMGGKTQLTSIVAAAVLLVIILFFYTPMTYLPNAALAGIVIVSALGFFNISYLKKLYSIKRREFFLSIITSLGVMTIGVLPGVGIAVGLSLLALVVRAAKPSDAVLGKVDNIDSYQNIDEYENAKTIPGLLIYRFDAVVVFFNADYFRSRIRALVNAANHKIEMVLIDCESINFIDATGNDLIDDLITELDAKGIKLAFTRPKKIIRDLFKKSGIAEKIGEEHMYTSVRAGVETFLNNKK